ncbi:hypothetical protein EDB87DRAFT_1574857 [Lactarius vividus]|nr:hypothetical protein EDB87DRAFT_1574857 [Lactarius vividus]
MPRSRTIKPQTTLRKLRATPPSTSNAGAEEPDDSRNLTEPTRPRTGETAPRTQLRHRSATAAGAHTHTTASDTLDNERRTSPQLGYSDTEGDESEEEDWGSTLHSGLAYWTQKPEDSDDEYNEYLVEGSNDEDSDNGDRITPSSSEDLTDLRFTDLMNPTDSRSRLRTDTEPARRPEDSSYDAEYPMQEYNRPGIATITSDTTAASDLDCFAQGPH